MLSPPVQIVDACSPLRRCLQARQTVYRLIREFFAERAVCEVETPLLHTAVDPEPAVQFFSVCDPYSPVPLFLHTSPEFAMKRLLAAGSGDIFQLCKVFRAGDFGRWHRPEFTLLEWYRTGWSMTALQAEVCELITTVLGHAYPVRVWRYADWFGDTWGWDPLEVDVEVLRTFCAAQIPFSDPDFVRHAERSALLDALLSHVLVPALDDKLLYVISHYPAEQAALARLDPEDPRYALRFEVYLAGHELANGYDELSDAHVQRARFLEQNRIRSTQGECVPPLDEAFLSALPQLPACAGVALGLDRLIALRMQAQSLAEVLPVCSDWT